MTTVILMSWPVSWPMANNAFANDTVRSTDRLTDQADTILRACAFPLSFFPFQFWRDKARDAV